MTTIPTALLIIAGLSVCLLMVAVMLILPHDMQDSYDIKRPQVGPTDRQRGRILLCFWLAPTAAMLAGWMIFG